MLINNITRVVEKYLEETVEDVTVTIMNDSVKDLDGKIELLEKKIETRQEVLEKKIDTMQEVCLRVYTHPPNIFFNFLISK